MGDRNSLKKIDVINIIDLKFVQNLQDFFAQTLDVAIVCVRNNEWLTQSSNNTEFCAKYIRHNKLGYRRCDECHKKWEKAAIKTRETVFYTCYTGLTNFIIPVFIEGEYLVSIFGGQFLKDEPDERYFKQIAKTLEVDEDEYFAAIKKVKVYSSEKVKAVVDLLFFLANSISTIAYANKKMAAMGVEYNIPRNIELEEWLFANYGNVKRPITGREFEILKLLVAGKNNNEIAKELFISVHTVKAHVSTIIEKFEVEDRVQVAVKAVREGLV